MGGPLLRTGLNRNEILRGYRSFAAVLSQGELIRSGIIRCFFLVGNTYRAGAKVGFAVARSLPSATKRNRLRRLMREAYRANKSILFRNRSHPAKCGVQMVLLCAPHTPRNASSITFHQIEECITTLLSDVRQRLG